MLPCPAQGPVSRSRRSPERFSLPERRSKVSNLIIRELCCSRIFKLKKGSLHTKGFRRINLCVFRYRLIKNCFAGPNSFRGFKGTSPRSCDDSNVMMIHTIFLFVKTPMQSVEFLASYTIVTPPKINHYVVSIVWQQVVNTFTEFFH